MVHLRVLAIIDLEIPQKANSFGVAEVYTNFLAVSNCHSHTFYLSPFSISFADFFVMHVYEKDANYFFLLFKCLKNRFY